MNRNGIGSHQSARPGKTEWLTPPDLISKLPKFDLDPCSPVNRPWPTAKNHFTIDDNGLRRQWFGMVWCNPPYDRSGEFLNKLKNHGNGIALIFARTETKVFFQEVWNAAHAILFLEGRLTFWHADGTKAAANGGAPSVLIAYGEDAASALEKCDIKGKFIYLK